MILVTGGAGFIGSNLQADLYASGHETIIVDWLGNEGKWNNLRLHPPSQLITPEGLDHFLSQAPPLSAVVHLGAISETTARDGDLVWQTNVTLSQKLWHWTAANRVRFIYASSAATYGDGSAGFHDDWTRAALARLKPLNLYGWSKHCFDLWVALQIESGAPAPPAWAGLKFFNVYGPNEYHKGKMISVVKVKHDELAAGGPVLLFKSDQPDLTDGQQRRDFIYIDDVVASLRFLLKVPSISGIFNIGTGQSRSYADLAHAVCHANCVPTRIKFIDMPASLKGQYQSFTEAPITRLRQAGFNHSFLSLEAGIDRYIGGFLKKQDPYR